MAELAALNVKISGDSGGLVAAVNSAQGSLTSFGRVTTAAEANARGFDRALRNTGGAATSLQQRINSLTGVMSTSRRSAETSARAFDALGDEALQSAAQMAAAARQAQAYGTQTTGATMQTANLAAQFNDIGVMLASGQSPLMLALQQGTQINQVFGQMGTGASRLRILGSALMSIISPANLMTIGVIAGGAALVQFGMNALSARDEAADLADTLSTLDDIQSTLSNANEILGMTTLELTEKYGQYADEVREAAKSLANLAEAQALQAMSAALADLGSEFGRLTSSGRAFDTAMTTALERIQAQFRVGYREAQALNRAFVALETATTWEQQVEALRNIETVMAQTGANAADLPPELLKALQQLNLMVIAAASVEDGLNDAAAAGANLSRSLPMTTFGIGPGLFNDDGSIALAPPRPEDEGSRGGMSLADRIKQDLERLREGFMSQAELQVAAYDEQKELLQSALERRLITQKEYNALMEDAERHHSQTMASIKQQEMAMVTSAQSGMYAELGNLFGVFASKSKGAAIAQIAINKALSIAQIIQNTAVAQMRALAELGPVAGPPVAAKIGAFGKVQAALAAATGFAQAAGVAGGGGGAAAIGATSAGATSQAGSTVSRNVAISLTGGDMFSRSQVVRLINSINEAVEDGAIVRVV